jgi:phage shock protein E
MAVALSGCLPQASTRPSPQVPQPPAPRSTASEPPSVTAEEAQELVARGALLVDVRTPEEFSSGHMDGAVNLPLQSLETGQSPDVPLHQPVIVYCRSGRRSAKAARALRERGFQHVYDLGPMPAGPGPR